MNVRSRVNTKQEAAGRELAGSVTPPQINNENTERWRAAPCILAVCYQLLLQNDQRGNVGLESGEKTHDLLQSAF